MAQKHKKSPRFEIKGPLTGTCNICGQFGRLTEDHVPPKSCRGIRDAEIRCLRDKLSKSGENSYSPRRVQAGPYFRTLCSRCNNLLGSKYDPALADFCRQVRTLATSGLELPAASSVDIAPQAVMRSVLGHFCAQGVDRYKKGPITEPLRDYLLDDAVALPSSLRFYYWLYPYRPQVQIRDAAHLSMHSSVVVGFWLMKFFPLAFFVTLNEPIQRQFALDHLDTFGRLAISDRERIRVELRPVIHPNWPEHPDNDSAIMYGPQALVADPRTRIARV